ncbi:MAG TPA: GGDEF domain-containing protein [Deltaproteobacteria bacterium]|mgnify:CR=1 FL=1|nr:GGDEF domain-containing protein [Deltaproteobacteria bacterium]HQB37754.1 GGDEF domain-containing protein [Deltaproteobacteria bacterium]
MSAFTNILSGKIRLPTPPAIAIKILETVRKDDFSFKELARVIESDPALAARVLRMANSSYYPVGPVKNIEKALSVLGTQSVQNIALSFVIVTEFKPESTDVFNPDLFWRRAITSAVAADMVARLVGYKGDDIFIIALLQDIGIMVLLTCRHKEYLRVFSQRGQDGRTLCELEEEAFGFDHQELGYEMLKRWDLPEDIYGPICYHHNETMPDLYKQQRDIIHVANALSSFYNCGKDVDKIRLGKSILDSAFGLTGNKVDKLIEDVAKSTLDLLGTFEIPPDSMKPFSEILQEANEELANLYDSYELRVIELKHAKEKAERLAKELRKAYETHKEMAYKDGLTNIYNHRYFQESLEHEFLRAKRYQRSFSLILLDVDDFKYINDTYGHTVGDLVLINLARTLQHSVRVTDNVARYGGEEFAVILPETDMEHAAVVAENIRSAVEELETTVDSYTIKLTVSLGISSFDATRHKNRQAMVNMADKGLYMAKNGGKNRVCAVK